VSLLTHAYLLAGLSGLTIAAVLVASKRAGKSKQIELELPASLDELRHALASPNSRGGVLADFGFLAAYGCTYVAAGALLARHGGVWIAIGCAGAVLGGLTAALDVRENLGILRALAHPDEADEAQRLRMKRASEQKWSVSAAALACLSTLFLWKAYWSIAIGVLYLAAAIGVVAGLRRRKLLGPALRVVAVALIAQVVLFTYCAHAFLDGF
jgi:fatty acid desaturase